MKAIEIANALLEEGYDEGRAIRIAIEEVRQGREMALVPVITDSFAPFKTFENRGEFQSFQRFAPLSRRSRVAAPQIFKADSGGRPS